MFWNRNCNLNLNFFFQFFLQKVWAKFLQQPIWDSALPFLFVHLGFLPFFFLHLGFLPFFCTFGILRYHFFVHLGFCTTIFLYIWDSVPQFFLDIWDSVAPLFLYVWNSILSIFFMHGIKPHHIFTLGAPLGFVGPSSSIFFYFKS